jgi:hypothetical protein
VIITFEAVEGEGENRKKKRPYRLQLNLLKEVDASRCKFDVAMSNMLVVLYKEKPGLWEQAGGPGQTR